MSESQPPVLVLRALGLGDLLTGVPALRGLRLAFPAHRLLLAAPRWLAPLVHHAGLADRVVGRAGLGPFPPGLAQPAVAVNLHGRGPESHRVLLSIRPERLVAFCHPEVPQSHGMPRWRDAEHEVARWCRLLWECGLPANPDDLAIQAPVSPLAALAGGATVIHPGAGSPARRWPPERFAAVARSEVARGRTVIVTGDACEVTLAEEVALRAGLGPTSVLAGSTGLLGLAAVVGAAERVVCGDTGVAHLARALGTPSVVLFGPVPPSLWGPPAGDPAHRALWAGQVGNPHGRVVDPGLLAIEVRDVTRALDELPTNKDHQPPPGRGAPGRKGRTVGREGPMVPGSRRPG